jgi:hypothetical protein
MNPVPAQVAGDEHTFGGKPDERVADRVAAALGLDFDPTLTFDDEASVDEKIGKNQLEVVGMIPDVALLVESFGCGFVTRLSCCGERVDSGVDLGLPGAMAAFPTEAPPRSASAAHTPATIS